MLAVPVTVLPLRPAEEDGAASDVGCVDVHVAVGNVDLAVELSEPFDVEVDRAWADHATAGNGNFGLTHAGHEGAEQAD